MPVFTLWGPNPFTEDKFIEAVELQARSVAAVHHSDVTARTLPAGTTLGRGAAWSGGPVVDFVPMYPDGRSYNALDSEASAAGDVVSGDGAPALGREAFRTTDDSRLLFYVPGGGFQQFPPGAVKRISAGNVLAWGLHYTADRQAGTRSPSPGALVCRRPAHPRGHHQADRRSAHHRGPRVRGRARTRRISR